MHDSDDLPDRVLTTIERRVKRRIRRQLTMAVLTIAFFFSVLMASTIPVYMGGHAWGMASGLLLIVWLPYSLWYLYRALVERGVQREIERERQHQLRLAREGAGIKREDRSTRLARFGGERTAFLADDGERWIEDELPLGDKPKRRLDA